VAQEAFNQINLTAGEVFGSGLDAVGGQSDLRAGADRATRLQDISGALGDRVRAGQITISGSVIGQVQVNLSGAATLGDVIDRINHALPASVQASLDPSGRCLQIASTDPSEVLQVSEDGNGTTAHDLGLFGPPQTGTLVGTDFIPRLTACTPVGALAGNRGVDLAGGLVMSNGDQSVTVDLSSAKTVQDILNAINATGLGSRPASTTTARASKWSINGRARSFRSGKTGARRPRTWASARSPPPPPWPI